MKLDMSFEKSPSPLTTSHRGTGFSTRDETKAPRARSSVPATLHFFSTSAYRRLKAEGKEEALERLAILVGAEHIDDVAYKFKVIPPLVPPN